MFLRSSKLLALGLSLIALSYNAEVSAAKSHGKAVQQLIKPAQAFLDDNSAFTVTDLTPIPFANAHFVEHVGVKEDNTVLVIKVAGQYDISILFEITNAIVGTDYTAAILLNGKTFLNIQTTEKAFLENITLGINPASIFLHKGDTLSVAFLNPPEGTIIEKRYFSIINDNQTLN